ncbi:MAG: hypothetical protein ACI32N_10570 [Bulleidia sp.]
MLKKYRPGFEIWGLILFLVIMIPNFIWFAVEAPHDILRGESVTETTDTIASVCQVLMIMALCLIRNRECGKIRLSRCLIAAGVSCLLYDLYWGFYYLGMTNAAVILGLTVFPCLSFLFFAMDRKNMIAVIPLSIFTVCHLIYAVVNFLI